MLSQDDRPTDPRSYQPSYAAAARRRRRWPWVVGIVVAGCVGLIAVAALLVSGALDDIISKEVPLTADERDLMLDADEIAEWVEGFSPDPAKEKVSKRVYYDGSRAIEYQYEHEWEDGVLYLYHSIFWERSLKDAKTVYTPMWGSAQVGVKLGGGSAATIEEQHGFFDWGDVSRFGILKAEAGPFGNLFVARSGQAVVYLFVSGIYFDDPETFAELLTPYLEMMQEFEPE